MVRHELIRLPYQNVSMCIVSMLEYIFDTLLLVPWMLTGPSISLSISSEKLTSTCKIETFH